LSIAIIVHVLINCLFLCVVLKLANLSMTYDQAHLLVI